LSRSRGLLLDVWAFVAFEYATGRTATLVGKPGQAMFEASARSMDLALADVAMVGDDLRADVAGARDPGIAGSWCRRASFARLRSRPPGSSPITRSPPWPTCPRFC
jgi:ribonucleotide monophosphatase NagD (HAD superfamily)